VSTLPELLVVVEKAYECIEVRTITAVVKGTTYNVVTLIQFSTASPDECEEKMRRCLDAHERLVGVPLQFDYRCLPATKLPELTAQLKTGKLNVGNLTASLGAGVALESFVSRVYDSGYIKKPTPYPMFQATLSTFSEATATKLDYPSMYSDDVLKQLRWCGFEWFRDLATYYLGASNTDPGGPSFVAIVAPVPAMVDDRLEFTPDGRRIRAHVRLHPKLIGSLRLTGDIIDGNLSGGRNKGPLKFGKLRLREEDQAYAEANFESTSQDDHVELRLVLEGITEIIHEQCLPTSLDGKPSSTIIPAQPPVQQPNRTMGSAVVEASTEQPALAPRSHFFCDAGWMAVILTFLGLIVMILGLFTNVFPKEVHDWLLKSWARIFS
jgi:hypothetical protein